MRRIMIVAALGASLALSACAVPDERSGTVASGTSRSATTLDQEPVTTEDLPAEPESNELRIGETFIYEDGLKVAVVNVRRTSMSEYAVGGSRARDDLLLVTAKVSATTRAVDLLVTTKLLYGRDGREAEAVFDGDKIDDFQGAPSVLGRGRSATGISGFAVPKGQKVQISYVITPGFDYSEAVFIGKG